MALQGSIQISGTKLLKGSGFVYSLGEETVTTDLLYVKVVSIDGNKDFISAVVSFSQEAESTVVLNKTYQFLLDLEGPNPIKQAYLHLKTLPEFADAVDC